MVRVPKASDGVFSLNGPILVGVRTNAVQSKYRPCRREAAAGEQCLTAPLPIGAGDSDYITSERPLAGRSDGQKFRSKYSNLHKKHQMTLGTL